jgi:hypothetical protein
MVVVLVGTRELGHKCVTICWSCFFVIEELCGKMKPLPHPNYSIETLQPNPDVNPHMQQQMVGQTYSQMGSAIHDGGSPQCSPCFAHVRATKMQKTFAIARQHADLKLSNVTSKRRNAHTHQVAASLFQFRTHSLNTMLKYCVKPLCMDDDDPKKEYYRKMYNRFCIYCKNVDEHTDHILTCQNNDDRKKIAIEVWNDIYEEIERKAKGNLNHTRS